MVLLYTDSIGLDYVCISENMLQVCRNLQHLCWQNSRNYVESGIQVALLENKWFEIWRYLNLDTVWNEKNIV